MSETKLPPYTGDAERVERVERNVTSKTRELEPDVPDGDGCEAPINPQWDVLEAMRKNPHNKPATKDPAQEVNGDE